MSFLKKGSPPEISTTCRPKCFRSRKIASSSATLSISPSRRQTAHMGQAWLQALSELKLTKVGFPRRMRQKTRKSFGIAAAFIPFPAPPFPSPGGIPGRPGGRTTRGPPTRSAPASLEVLRVDRGLEERGQEQGDQGQHEADHEEPGRPVAAPGEE